MKFSIHKKAYYMRLLSTIICIFTCVAVLCTVFLSILEYQQKNRERELLNNSRVSMFRQQTDVQLNTALIQIEMFRNDTDFAQFAISGSYDAANALGIYDKMSENRFLFDNLGISIGVYCPHSDICIMSGSDRPDMRELGIDYDALSLTSFTMIDNNGTVPMDDGEQVEGAMFVIMQRYLGSYDIVFLFVINNINNLSVDPEDNFVLVYENRPAYASSDVELPEGILQLDAGAEKLKNLEIYQEESQVFPSIRYIYYTPSDIGVSAWKSLAVFLMCMLFGCLLALIVVKRLYKPINTTLDSIAKLDAGAVTADNELEYVTHAMQRMNEDIERLQKSDSEYHQMRCDEFLRGLLGGLLAEGEMKEKLRELDMPLLEGQFRLICADVIGFGSQYQDMDNNMYRIICNDLADIFRGEVFADVQVYTVFMPDSRLVFVTPFKDYSKQLEELCVNIEADYEIDMLVVMSAGIDNIAETEQRYNEAVYVMENGLYGDGTHVVDADRCAAQNKRQSRGVYYPMEIEHKIIENMAGGEVDNAIELVRKILDSNVENGLISREWTQIKFLFASTINRILSRLNITEEEVFGEDSVLYLELSERNEDAKKTKIVSVFETLGGYVRDKLGEKNGQLEKITEFIDNNIEHDVSLLDLAEYMGLSTSYVSKLFKTLANQNFKTYVNMRRIENAKQIMRTEKNIKIAEVAARIGCNNTVTFNRMFQKYTGMTPGQFLK